MRKLKLSILIFLFVFIPVNISGCNENREEDIPIVSIILFGKHANSQCFDVQLESNIQRVYSSFGNIGIVVVDGAPSLLRTEESRNILGCYDADYQKESRKLYDDNNIMWQKQYLKKQTREITEALEVCKADDDEVDTLGALCTAAEALNTIEGSMGTSVKKEIIILDTGLCTSGALNFQKPEYLEVLGYDGKLWEDDIMMTKVSGLINHLEKQAEIPNLKGINVTWYGLGQVVEPQQLLSKLGTQNLQYIWGELLSAAGALPPDIANVDEKHGMFVSTSTYGVMESEKYVTPIQLDVNVSLTTPEIPEQKIKFVKNSDEFLSPEEEDAINIYAVALKNYPDEKVLLIGTTSSWNGGSLELSEKRSKKVKDSMIKFGISENRISIVGLGYNPKYCRHDSPDGQFEESIAKENRSVLIVLYDSPKAQEVLAGD